MAVANLRTSIEEQVTCAICHEHFTDPRLLPCLHTYCKHCVDAIVRAPSRTHGEITCPEYREIVKINPGATNQFKVNFQMNNLLSLLAINSPEDAAAKTKLSCENCSTDEAVKGRCIDCCKFMCEFCLKTHKRFLETQDHKMMTLEEVKQHGAPALTPKVKCEKHKGEAKKLFCESCQELICRDCTIVDHREHQFQFIEVVAKKHKASLKGDVEEALKAEKKVEEALTSVKTMKQRIHVQTENIQKEIDGIIDKKIADLEEKRRNLRKEVKSLAETKTANLDIQEDDLKMKLASLKSSIAFSKELLRNDNNVNIVSVSSEARSRLSTLSRAPFNNQPCQNDSLKLQVNDAAYNRSLGNLMKVVETSKMRRVQPSFGQKSNTRRTRDEEYAEYDEDYLNREECDPYDDYYEDPDPYDDYEEPSILQLRKSIHMKKISKSYTTTVEPPFATTSPKRPVFQNTKSNITIDVGTSRKRPPLNFPF